MTDAVASYGLWIRNHHGSVQVLVETWPGCEWRQVYLGEVGPGTSEIINPSGIRCAPIVNHEKDFNPPVPVVEPKEDQEPLFKDEK